MMTHDEMANFERLMNIACAMNGDGDTDLSSIRIAALPAEPDPNPGINLDDSDYDEGHEASDSFKQKADEIHKTHKQPHEKLQDHIWTQKEWEWYKKEHPATGIKPKFKPKRTPKPGEPAAYQQMVSHPNNMLAGNYGLTRLVVSMEEAAPYLKKFSDAMETVYTHIIGNPDGGQSKIQTDSGLCAARKEFDQFYASKLTPSQLDALGVVEGYTANFKGDSSSTTSARLSAAVGRAMGFSEQDYRSFLGNNTPYVMMSSITDQEILGARLMMQKEQMLAIASGLVDEDGMITLSRSASHHPQHDKYGQNIVRTAGSYADSWTYHHSAYGGSSPRIMAKVHVSKIVAAPLGRGGSSGSGTSTPGPGGKKITQGWSYESEGEFIMSTPLIYGVSVSSKSDMSSLAKSIYLHNMSKAKSERKQRMASLSQEFNVIDRISTKIMRMPSLLDRFRYIRESMGGNLSQNLSDSDIQLAASFSDPREWNSLGGASGTKAKPPMMEYNQHYGFDAPPATAINFPVGWSNPHTPDEMAQQIWQLQQIEKANPKVVPHSPFDAMNTKLTSGLSSETNSYVMNPDSDDHTVAQKPVAPAEPLYMNDLDQELPSGMQFIDSSFSRPLKEGESKIPTLFGNNNPLPDGFTMSPQKNPDGTWSGKSWLSGPSNLDGLEVNPAAHVLSDKAFLLQTDDSGSVVMCYKNADNKWQSLLLATPDTYYPGAQSGVDKGAAFSMKLKEIDKPDGTKVGKQKVFFNADGSIVSVNQYGVGENSGGSSTPLKRKENFSKKHGLDNKPPAKGFGPKKKGMQIENGELSIAGAKLADNTVAAWPICDNMVLSEGSDSSYVVHGMKGPGQWAPMLECTKDEVADFHFNENGKRFTIAMKDKTNPDGVAVYTVSHAFGKGGGEKYKIKKMSVDDYKAFKVQKPEPEELGSPVDAATPTEWAKSMGIPQGGWKPISTTVNDSGQMLAAGSVIGDAADIKGVYGNGDLGAIVDKGDAIEIANRAKSDDPWQKSILIPKSTIAGIHRFKHGTVAIAQDNGLAGWHMLTQLRADGATSQHLVGKDFLEKKAHPMPQQKGPANELPHTYESLPGAEGFGQAPAPAAKPKKTPAPVAPPVDTLPPQTELPDGHSQVATDVPSWMKDDFKSVVSKDADGKIYIDGSLLLTSDDEEEVSAIALNNRTMMIDKDGDHGYIANKMLDGSWALSNVYGTDMDAHSMPDGTSYVKYMDDGGDENFVKIKDNADIVYISEFDFKNAISSSGPKIDDSLHKSPGLKVENDGFGGILINGDKIGLSDMMGSGIKAEKVKLVSDRSMLMTTSKGNTYLIIKGKPPHDGWVHNYDFGTGAVEAFNGKGGEKLIRKYAALDDKQYFMLDESKIYPVMKKIDEAGFNSLVTGKASQNPIPPGHTEVKPVGSYQKTGNTFSQSKDDNALFVNGVKALNSDGDGPLKVTQIDEHAFIAQPGGDFKYFVLVPPKDAPDCEFVKISQADSTETVYKDGDSYYVASSMGGGYEYSPQPLSISGYKATKLSAVDFHKKIGNLYPMTIDGAPKEGEQTAEKPAKKSPASPDLKSQINQSYAKPKVNQAYHQLGFPVGMANGAFQINGQIVKGALTPGEGLSGVTPLNDDVVIVTGTDGKHVIVKNNGANGWGVTNVSSKAPYNIKKNSDGVYLEDTSGSGQYPYVRINPDGTLKFANANEFDSAVNSPNGVMVDESVHKALYHVELAPGGDMVKVDGQSVFKLPHTNLPTKATPLSDKVILIDDGMDSHAIIKKQDDGTWNSVVTGLETANVTKDANGTIKIDAGKDMGIYSISPDSKLSFDLHKKPKIPTQHNVEGDVSAEIPKNDSLPWWAKLQTTKKGMKTVSTVTLGGSVVCHSDKPPYVMSENAVLVDNGNLGNICVYKKDESTDWTGPKSASYHHKPDVVSINKTADGGIAIADKHPTDPSLLNLTVYDKDGNKVSEGSAVKSTYLENLGKKPVSIGEEPEEEANIQMDVPGEQLPPPPSVIDVSDEGEEKPAPAIPEPPPPTPAIPGDKPEPAKPKVKKPKETKTPKLNGNAEIVDGKTMFFGKEVESGGAPAVYDGKINLLSSDENGVPMAFADASHGGLSLYKDHGDGKFTSVLDIPAASKPAMYLSAINDKHGSVYGIQFSHDGESHMVHFDGKLNLIDNGDDGQDDKPSAAPAPESMPEPDGYKMGDGYELAQAGLQSKIESDKSAPHSFSKDSSVKVAGLNGVPFKDIEHGAPQHNDGEMMGSEPDFMSYVQKHGTMHLVHPGFTDTQTPYDVHASGVIMVEPDGRVWFVNPTNEFGGVKACFPKGKLENFSPLMGSIKEGMEESGLVPQIMAPLGISQTGSGKCKYYLAKRVDGSPYSHGWESGSVSLGTLDQAKAAFNKDYHKGVVDQIKQWMKDNGGDESSNLYDLMSNSVGKSTPTPPSPSAPVPEPGQPATSIPATEHVAQPEQPVQAKKPKKKIPKDEAFSGLFGDKYNMLKSVLAEHPIASTTLGEFSKQKSEWAKTLGNNTEEQMNDYLSEGSPKALKNALMSSMSPKNYRSQEAFDAALDRVKNMSPAILLNYLTHLKMGQ